MDASVRGLPLLSGPPPEQEEPNNPSCRRCSKDLGIIFRSSRHCQFCGYTYCTSCCDHQALMPRSGVETGYDVVNVCSFCIDYLTITASGRNQLRATPVAKLKAYIKAFNIQTPGAVEKDDIVQAILGARMTNGCLPYTNEDYYRRTAVPDQRRGRPQRSFLDRAADAANAARQAYSDATSGSTSARPRPAPRPASQPPPQSRPTPPSQTRPQASRPPQSRPQHPYQPRPAPPTPASTRPSPVSTRPAPPPRPPTPIPPLSELLDKSLEEISSLSAHVLKEILHQNHVNARLLLEKSDLVDKVRMLVENERRDREREEEIRRQEEQEIINRQHRMMADMREREEARRRSQDIPATPLGGASTSLPEINTLEGNGSTPPLDAEVAASLPLPKSPSPQPVTTSVPTHGSLERSGMCIVCQDAEANMALVDCGHLALCKPCSDLIWNSTRECPLCRTRIVTPDRMLRIFRT